MLALLPLAALAGTVSLHVGIHRDAGTIYDVAADGAAGQCAVAPGRLTCPAEGPVRFRWARGGPWAMTGDTVLEPGQDGVAWVLAPDDLREAAQEVLRSPDVTPEWIRSTFIRAGRFQPSPPSWGMWQDLLLLLRRPDVELRVAAVEAVTEWVSSSPLDFLPPEAPNPLPPGVLRQLGRDHDRRVRRKVAVMIRDMRGTELSTEAADVLAALMDDEVQSVRRAAMATAPLAFDQAVLDGQLAWKYAMQMVPQPEGPGRAACNTLARLASRIEARPPTVDPQAAVELCLAHHTERAWRVWTAWRHVVPFRAKLARVLIRDSVGMGNALLQHWAQTHPDDLAALFREWEPSSPHSERFEVAQTALSGVEHKGLRQALALSEGERTPLDRARTDWAKRLSIDWDKVMKRGVKTPELPPPAPVDEPDEPPVLGPAPGPQASPAR